MEKKRIARDPALDLVRIFACFSVIGVHFFLNSGFYDTVILGGRMFAATVIRAMFMSCVPLFLLLSGYLMNSRTPTRQYYRKLIPVIGEYLLASLFCILYACFKDGLPGDLLQFFKEQLYLLFSYRSSQYGWYVEMYIGFFLLIPYLNIVYHQLSDRKQKRDLVLILLLLTALPGVTNSFSTLYKGFEVSFQLLPQWWITIYPITYYFIGAYLREYPISFPRPALLGMLLLSTLVNGAFAYWKSHGGLFIEGPWQTYNSILDVIHAVLLFSFLRNVPCRQTGWIPRALAVLSDLCFSAYLVSAIFDDIVYNTWDLFRNPMVYRLEYFVLTTPVVFVCSLLLAGVIRFLYNGIQRGALSIRGRR